VIPIYPRSHLLSGQTGGATLKYKVSPQGRVSQTRVLESTDLTVNGEASPSVHKQTFTFQIISKSFYSIEVLPPGKPSTVPYPRNAIRPIYPEALRDQNLRGHCDFVMTVNSAGHVTDVQSENTSHPLFLESGLITAKKWKFIPQTITRDQLKIRVTFLFTPQSQSGQ